MLSKAPKIYQNINVGRDVTVDQLIQYRLIHLRCMIDGRSRGFQLEWRQSHETGQQRIQVVFEFVIIFGINLNLDLKKIYARNLIF